MVTGHIASAVKKQRERETLEPTLSFYLFWDCSLWTVAAGNLGLAFPLQLPHSRKRLADLPTGYLPGDFTPCHFGIHN